MTAGRPKIPRRFGVALAVLLGLTAGVGSATPLAVHHLSNADFDGVIGANTTGTWNVSSMTGAFVTLLPTTLTNASISNLTPTLVSSTLTSWKLPGNLSASATYGIEWVVVIAASATLNSTFVLHFRVGGHPFGLVAGSSYFVLPLTGLGPWTLQLYSPLSGKSPGPTLTAATMGVFLCASHGVCP